MPTMSELQERSNALFTDRLSGRAATFDATAPPRFHWFDPDDAADAVALTAQMAIASARSDSVEDGLASALDLAESRTDLPPQLVAQAMAMFVTHHRPARRLVKPRTVRAVPQLFGPSRGAGTVDERRTPTPEDVLDYWREDPFANEHHEHWHQVYPFAGLVPADWLVWADTADRAGLAALLGAMDATHDWPTFLVSATPEEIRDTFFDLVNAQPDFAAVLRGLSPIAYRTLFRLNDRQGELFLYMHSQMLARYDAERLALGRSRVEAFGPSNWAAPIPESYDPGPDLPDFTPRGPNEKLPQRDIDLLTTWHAALAAAIGSGDLVRLTGPSRAVDSERLGEATEAAAARLTGLDLATYPGIHNFGHNMLGALPDDQGEGVMISTVVAIRDPIFWRWHKYVDQINTAWQDTQSAYDLSDTPPVVVRDRLAGPPQPWVSPDLVLVSTAGLAEGADPTALLSSAIGGAVFDSPVAAGPIAGAAGLEAVDELTTRMTDSTLSDGRVITHLTHDPFALVVRVRNAATRPTAITVRSFIAPAAEAGDRTMWMELDKFLVEVPAGGRAVLYRPDAEFSVVKKPAETDPGSVLEGEGDPNDPDYCDCGWPYTLLLPRGRPDGAEYRLAVICTDASRDLVRPSGGCGSMSFCGAVDRYPDTRDMGYPFSRPFADSLAATLLRVQSAAGRSLTIRHVET